MNHHQAMLAAGWSTVTLAGLSLMHVCEGAACLKCAMLRRGYVRSFAGFWWQPNGDGPLLTDEEAQAMMTPTLFDLIDIGSAPSPNGHKEKEAA